MKKIKFNIIDFAVILAILAAIVFLGSKLLKPAEVEEAKDRYVLTLSSNEISNFVIDKLESEGFDVRIYDESNKKNIGKIIDYERAESQSSFTGSDGQWRLAPKPDYSSINLFVELEGTKKPNGLNVSGHEYHSGEYIVVRAGIVKMYLEITSITKAE